MSNVIELSAFNGARSPRSSENGALNECRTAGRPYHRSGRNMHTFVFRSYNLIMESTEADLVRDVRFDVEKAQTKLKSIRRQIAADREHAAAREKLLTTAEAKLGAAIVAAQSLTRAPAPLLEPPSRTKSRGRIFTKDPMPMTGKELAALVAMLPIADQEVILTILRQMAKGRTS